MPAGDGTGSDGRGGFCTPLLESGQIRYPLRRGFFGRGRGFRWNIASAFQQPSKEDEKQMLENEAKALEQELSSIKKRIEELK